MKERTKILVTIAAMFGLFVSGITIAFAVPVSVPAAPGNGYMLVSTSTGAYNATTTDPAHFGSIYGTSTATSTLNGGINLVNKGCFALGGVCITGGVAYPFTPSTNYSVTSSATNTPIWAQAGLFASSTSHFVNLDFSLATGTAATTTNFAITGVLSKLLKTGADGSVIAAVSSTDYAPATSGSSLQLANGSGGFSSYAGSTCTNQAATAISAVGAATCNSISDSYLTGQVGLAHGGTNASLSGASQMIAMNSGNTALTSFSSATLSSNGVTFTNSTTTNATSTNFWGNIINGATANVNNINATSTSQINNFSGKIIGYDATNSWNGVISPTHSFGLSTATTTTWAGTTSAAYQPSLTMPFNGTLEQVRCSATSSAAYLGVNPYVNGASPTPQYFIASSTAGVVKFTAGNTFTAGQSIAMTVGTSSITSTANIGVTCTFDVIQN